MKVLVTGANGQLGQDLIEGFGSGFEVHAAGREELDVTDFERVQAVVRSIKPDVILHAAAYTAVDRAEEEVDRAYEVNAYGTRNLVVAAQAVGAKICYISTDYVFDGRGDTPWRESDPTSPLNVYGKSKLAGEEFVKGLSTRWFIVRTSWVYGKHGKNFVKTMLRLAEGRDNLSVVCDQFGSPTYTGDLVGFLAALIRTERYGIYHASNSGSCSWHEFAEAIFAEVGARVKVTPIPSIAYPVPAPRPSYSVMDHMAIRLNGFHDLRHWKEGLHEFLQDWQSHHSE